MNLSTQRCYILKFAKRIRLYARHLLPLADQTWSSSLMREHGELGKSNVTLDSEDRSW